jgi:L-threonylcarbamoyladenylate synthase
MILDGGPCTAGLESTIIALTGDKPVLLRTGALDRSALEEVLGQPLVTMTDGARPQAPGMLASHYAPRAMLRLDAKNSQPGEAFLGFGAFAGHGSGAMLNLSESGDLREAAANLFAFLRELDSAGAGEIAVAPIPETGLGEAINDRLRRAAAPRPEPARS